MTDAMDREIDRLERELEDPDLTDKERREVRRDLREIGQEEHDREQWEDEGRERGWR